MKFLLNATLFILISFTPSFAFSQDIPVCQDLSTKNIVMKHLTWTANPEVDMAHYNIYHSTVSAADLVSVKGKTPIRERHLHKKGTDNQYRIPNGVVGNGSNWFTVTAVDTSMNESGPAPAVVCSHKAIIPVPPHITSPANGSMLSGANVEFTWTAGTSDIVEFQLCLATKPEILNDSPWGDIYCETVSGGSVTVPNIPTDGSTIYVRLWHKVEGGQWTGVDTSYVTLHDSTAPSVPKDLELK